MIHGRNFIAGAWREGVGVIDTRMKTSDLHAGPAR